MLLAEIAGDGLDQIIEATPEDARRFREQAQRANRAHIMRAMELFMRVESEMKWATQPRAMLELAAVRACHPEQEEDAQLSERIARMERQLEKGVTLSPVQSAPVENRAESAPAPEKSAQSAKKISVPAATPPAEYLAAIERLGAENPSIKNMLPQMIFAGIEDGVVTVEFESRSVNVRGVLERKTALIEAALSSAFGQSMRLRFRNVGEGPVKMNAEAKKTINQAYDIFGRDKIELTD